MSKTPTNKSISHERKVQGYLKPINFQLVKGFTIVNEVGDSEAINMIVRDFFNRLPEQQKNEYLSKARQNNHY